MASLPHCPLLLLPARAAAPLRRSYSTPGGWRQVPPPPLRGGAAVVRLSPGFADFGGAETWAREIIERAEGVVYTVADAVVAASPPTEAVVEEGTKQSGDWLSGITNYLESVLKVLKDGLSALHVPYAYGFAIILLTILVKAATFPLTKKQVESAMAMRTLQPQVKAVQERYAGDQERIQLETARLYKLAGVNPFAGCLPTLATIPVWIGLYRALSNVANEGLLTEGFFWIPSLAGPTTIAAKQSGSGISWLFPFVDGHPPLGWPDTLAYLVLPALLVVSQYISTQIMQPTQGNDPSQKSSQVLTRVLPLMIGYFALSVPSGLSLYWFTNNVLSTAQQIWLQKLGGAKNTVIEYTDATRGSPPDVPKSETKIREPHLDIDSTKKIDSVKQVSYVKESFSQDKQDSGGLRRGERFKEIREQEARRRREREEARRKADEAADTSGLSDTESSIKVYAENTLQVESSLEVVEEKSLVSAPPSDSLFSDPPRINGSYSKQDVEERRTDTCEPTATDTRDSGSSSEGLPQNGTTENTKGGNS